MLAIIFFIFATLTVRAVDGSDVYCYGSPLVDQNGLNPTCPPNSYVNSSMNLCCKDTPWYDNQKPISEGYNGNDQQKPISEGYNGNDQQKPISEGYNGTTVINNRPDTVSVVGRDPSESVCFAGFIVNGTPRCPKGGVYVSRTKKCCFPAGTTLDNHPESVERIGKTNNIGHNCNKVCVDKHPPGKASDCPNHLEKCDDPNWYDFMTNECPKTCGRCCKTTRVGANCQDGKNHNGVSECPENEHLCDHPDYISFMKLECPFTCGVCSRRRRHNHRSRI